MQRKNLLASVGLLWLQLLRSVLLLPCAMLNVNVVAFTLTRTHIFTHNQAKKFPLSRAFQLKQLHLSSTSRSSRQGNNNFFQLGFSSLSSGFTSPSNGEENNSNNEDEQAKWERMYNQNANASGANKGGEQASSTSSSSMSSGLKSEVRVVSFDLDNTIWKTSNVINAANDALAEHMSNVLNLDDSIRVEKVMGTLFKADKAKYCPMSAKDVVDLDSNGSLDHIKAPTLLTQLRKDAILEVFKNHSQENDDHDNDPIVFAEEAFQVWANARHDAIPNNFASSVLQCLDEIRQLQTIKGNPVVVGAITDGNSDPRKVALLTKYFDFVVNAERVGVSKPDRRIYDAAIQHVSSDLSLNHVFDTYDNDDDDDDAKIDLNALLDQIGPWWIHIGDDFVKDIVACKDVNMRSIWSRELVLDKLSSSSSSPPPPPVPERPQRTEDDLKKEVSENKTLRMIIGTEDYVLDSIQGEFADAIVDNFGDVSKVITMWHEEGLVANDAGSTTEETKREVDLPDYFTIVLPDEDGDGEVKNEGEKKDNISMGVDDTQGNTGEVKFCIMCGEKLPMEAKFCSSCGNKQPDFNAAT